MHFYNQNFKYKALYVKFWSLTQTNFSQTISRGMLSVDGQVVVIGLIGYVQGSKKFWKCI